MWEETRPVGTMPFSLALCAALLTAVLGGDADPPSNSTPTLVYVTSAFSLVLFPLGPLLAPHHTPLRSSLITPPTRLICNSPLISPLTRITLITPPRAQSAVSTNKIGSIKEVEGRFYHDFYFYCAFYHPKRDQPTPATPFTPPRPPLAVAWRDPRRRCDPAAHGRCGSARLGHSTNTPTPTRHPPYPTYAATLPTAPSSMTRMCTFSPHLSS